MIHQIKKLIKLILENELENLKKPEITVYVDMDGVLADFYGALAYSDVISQSQKALDKLLSQKPELQGLLGDQLKEKFRGRQEDPVMAKLKKAWNKHIELTYSTASQPGFFLNLEMLPGAKEMLNAAYNLTGDLPNILTAPMESNPKCKEEKYEWVQKNIVGLYNNFYCTQNKEKFANSEFDILIDDRPKYTNKFISAGGSAILYTSAEQSIKELEEIVSSLKRIDEISAIGVGGGAVQSSGKVVGTGGNPLGGDMSGQHEIMWSVGEPAKRYKK